MLISFKNRVIDKNKPVKVYKNLTLNCYSILQDGLVVAHANKLMLANVIFTVRKFGRSKVLKTKTKNVHAYASGLLVESAMGISADDYNILPAKISYNPFKYGCFYCDNLTNKPFGVKSCSVVKFNEDGLTGSYLSRCDIKA